jgi:hypothetical protein
MLAGSPPLGGLQGAAEVVVDGEHGQERGVEPGLAGALELERVAAAGVLEVGARARSGLVEQALVLGLERGEPLAGRAQLWRRISTSRRAPRRRRSPSASSGTARRWSSHVSSSCIALTNPSA